MGKKTIIEVHNAQKQKRLCGAGAWGTDDCLHPGSKWNHSLWSDVVSQERNGRLSELAFGRIDNKPVLTEPFKQLLEVCQVFFRRRAGYKNVVHRLGGPRWRCGVPHCAWPPQTRTWVW